MHSAPSVSFPVGRSRFEVWMIFLVLILGALVSAIWIGESTAIGWREWTCLVVWVAALISLLATLKKPPEGLLIWRQEGWFRVSSLARGPQELQGTSVTVHLDLQFMLLLRFSAVGGASQWLWLERAHAPARWLDLRRAVFAAPALRV